MLLRKIKWESEIRCARGWSDISIGRSGRTSLRRQHLSRDLEEERGALQVSGEEQGRQRKGKAKPRLACCA